MASIPQDNVDLTNEISTASGRTRRLASYNYSLAWATAIVAVISSISAALVAAFGEDNVPRYVVAIVAALPAIVMAINMTFSFEQRGIWHFRTTKRFEGLVRKLKYENADVASVSKEFSQIDLETFDGWIDYSNLSGQRNRIEGPPERPTDDTATPSGGSTPGTDNVSAIQQHPASSDGSGNGSESPDAKSQ